MRKIDVQELIKYLQNFVGKQVEVGTNPLWSVNTYQSFRFEDTENVLMFNDGGNNGRQEIFIDKDQIVEITLSEGRDIYESVINIILQDGKIDFTISSMPIKCFKCHKIIDEPMETKWFIRGTGSYGSRFEDEKLDIAICDNCLYYEVLGYKDSDFE